VRCRPFPCFFIINIIRISLQQVAFIFAHRTDKASTPKIFRSICNLLDRTF
jgi:hypothetical protein